LGSSGAIAFAPVYEHGGIRVNPIVGGRYQKIKEQFSFLGVDSGLAYVGGGDDDTPDNAKVFPDYNGVDNNNDFFIDNLAEDGTPDFTQINSFDPVLVTATHMAQVTSNLAGPDFGFHYTLGDDKGIALVGSSRLAAMFNNEQITIRGDNLYNHMAVSATPDPVTGLFPPTDGFDTNNLNGPSANAYGGSYSTVHLSPLFEQTLTAEIPIFSRVPVLSNMKLLEDAKFRLGYTFLCVGEVADPLQSVIYTSNPQLNLFPSIKPDRHSFTQHTISVGVNWNY
ncbi:MAG TPA: hypothetical protein DIT89_14450, partial [Planctomycetaceae bacterium]|nr:hypothetical protein [Planctomycetaceae bacterium]